LRLLPETSSKLAIRGNAEPARKGAGAIGSTWKWGGKPLVMVLQFAAGQKVIAEPIEGRRRRDVQGRYRSHDSEERFAEIDSHSPPPPSPPFLLQINGAGPRLLQPASQLAVLELGASGAGRWLPSCTSTGFLTGPV